MSQKEPRGPTGHQISQPFAPGPPASRAATHRSLSVTFVTVPRVDGDRPLLPSGTHSHGS